MSTLKKVISWVFVIIVAIYWLIKIETLVRDLLHPKLTTPLSSATFHNENIYQKCVAEYSNLSFEDLFVKAFDNYSKSNRLSISRDTYHLQLFSISACAYEGEYGRPLTGPELFEIAGYFIDPWKEFIYDLTFALLLLIPTFSLYGA